MKPRIEITVDEHRKLKHKAEKCDRAEEKEAEFRRLNATTHRKNIDLRNERDKLKSSNIALERKIQEMKYVTRIMTIFYSLGVILMGAAIIVLLLKLN